MHKLLALNQRQKMVIDVHLDAISNLWKYSTDFWYFETGTTKKDRRSFYGYKKAKRAFRIKKEWLVDLLLPALPFCFL